MHSHSRVRIHIQYVILFFQLLYYVIPYLALDIFFFFFFFQAEDGIRDDLVTGVQTCALPIWDVRRSMSREQRQSRFSSPVVHKFIPTRSRASYSNVTPKAAGPSLHDWRTDSRSEERRVGKEGRSRWSPYH